MKWVIEGHEYENDKGKRCVDRGVQKTGRTGEEQTKMDNRKKLILNLLLYYNPLQMEEK